MVDFPLPRYRRVPGFAISESTPGNLLIDGPFRQIQVDVEEGVRSLLRKSLDPLVYLRAQFR